MLNPISRSWLIGGWLATVALIIASSVLSGASLSTSVLLFAIGVAPAVIMVILGGNGPSPTVAEILHSVETKDRR